MGHVQMLEMQIIVYICLQSDGVLASTVCASVLRLRGQTPSVQTRKLQGARWCGAVCSRHWDTLFSE